MLLVDDWLGLSIFPVILAEGGELVDYKSLVIAISYDFLILSVFQWLVLVNVNLYPLNLSTTFKYPMKVSYITGLLACHRYSLFSDNTCTKVTC